jgi:hypothetical protein
VSATALAASDLVADSRRVEDDIFSGVLFEPLGKAVGCQGLVVENSTSLVEAVGVLADLETERGRFGVGGGDDRGGDVLRGGGGVGGPHLVDCLGDFRKSWDGLVLACLWSISVW